MAQWLATPTLSSNQRGWLRAIIWWILAGAACAWALELGRMIFFHNTHTVLAGRVYRTAQMTPEQLEKFVRKHQIRTVINLRGRPMSDWYPKEARLTQQLEIAQEDITVSANRLPAPSEVRRLIEVFDLCEYPVVIHCKQGADRTGLASAIALLLYSDADYESARHQCSPRYGHVGMFNSTIAMDKFFAFYENWLKRQCLEHSPERFRHWATTEYVPGNAAADLSVVKPRDTLPLNQPFTVTIRAKNRGIEPWRFTVGTGVGVHARYTLTGPYGEVATGRTSYRATIVEPGASIDIPVALPAIKQAGIYRLYIDLSEQNVDFVQYGSEPLFYEWNCSPTTKVTGQ